MRYPAFGDQPSRAIRILPRPRQLHHLRGRAGSALHRIGDLAGDRGGRGLHGVAGKVRVPMRCGGLRVAKHLAE